MKFLIVILALIFFIVFKIYQKTRAPKGLENVPTLSYFKLFIELLTNAGPDKCWENIKEQLEKKELGR